MASKNEDRVALVMMWSGAVLSIAFAGFMIAFLVALVWAIPDAIDFACLQTWITCPSEISHE